MKNYSLLILIYKYWVHEGVISTPLIAHWPEKITDKNAIRHQPGHLIDIMATVIEISDADYPGQFNGNDIHSLPGKSLLGVFTDDKQIERDAIYYEHEGNRGLRQGKWKLVSKAYPQAGKFREPDTIPVDQWALYNMEEDRTELNDLADEFPPKVKELSEKWQKWAVQTNAVPKPK